MNILSARKAQLRVTGSDALNHLTDRNDYSVVALSLSWSNHLDYHGPILRLSVEISCNCSMYLSSNLKMLATFKIKICSLFKFNHSCA